MSTYNFIQFQNPVKFQYFLRLYIYKRNIISDNFTDFTYHKLCQVIYNFQNFNVKTYV